MEYAESALVILFWTCLSAVFYAYLGYPVLIYCLARLFGRRRIAPRQEVDLPKVSLLIAAYNEESEIERRILNAVALDYPAERLEIVIAADGCSDRTAEIVRKYADRGVRLIEYGVRRGKATVLNETVPQLCGEIVIFSDANTQTAPDAARRLVAWFQDSKVGAVCGRLVLTDPAGGRNVDSLYWKYETFLKHQESGLGALLGANGGLYALRKALFAPIPPDAVLDDLVIPLLAKLRSGRDIVFEPGAVAYEETPASVRSEFHRRSRLGAGGFGSIRMLAGLLQPWRGWICFTFLSHKVLRWFCPFCLAAMLIANLLLAGERFYLALMIGQLFFYGTAMVAAYIPSQQKVVKLLRLTTMFTSMNGAILIGFARWVRGTQRVTWTRTTRMADARLPAQSAPARA